MTNTEIKNLQADIKGMLMQRVEDIFIDMQNAMGIKNGDVFPLDAINLENAEDKLAEQITLILASQKGAENES